MKYYYYLLNPFKKNIFLCTNFVARANDVCYSILCRKRMINMGQYKSVKQLTSELTNNPDVQSFFVNERPSHSANNSEEMISDNEPVTQCEANKRTQPYVGETSQFSDFDVNSHVDGKMDDSATTDPPNHCILINGSNRGKALIICNNIQLSNNPTSGSKTISETRTQSLKHSRKVFAHHFGFHVSMQIFCLCVQNHMFIKGF